MYADMFKFDKNGLPMWNADVTKIYAEFDPTKIADQFMKGVKAPSFEALDMSAVLEIQRKNLEALNQAGHTALEGAQAVAQKQADLFKAAFDQISTAADTLSKASTPQDLVAKQADLCKAAFETALANTKKVTDMVTKANDAAAKVINARIVASFDEAKAQCLKAKQA